MPYYADEASALADGCLHYWPFDESSGSAISDMLSGFDAQVIADASFSGGSLDQSIVAGVHGNARTPSFHGFDTVDKILGIEANPADSGFTDNAEFSDFSVRCVFRYASLANDWKGSIPFFLGSSGKNIQLYLDSNTLSVYTADGFVETIPISANTWYDVVVTNSGTALEVFINGVSVGSDTHSSPIGVRPYGVTATFAGRATTGNFAQNDIYFILDGIIDECAFWDRALTSQEVSTLNGQSLIEQGVVIPPALPLPPRTARTSYRAKLTGSNNALSDIEMPISSFNARLRSGRESFLSIVVPNGGSFISAIEARPDGELVIEEHSEGISTELARVNFQKLRIDKGSRSGTSLSISGYKQTTNGSPAGWLISDYSYFSRSDNKSRVRVQSRASVKPADYITAEGLTFIADTVTLVGSVNRVSMEISE